jgi:hypothetical protein
MCVHVCVCVCMCVRDVGVGVHTWRGGPRARVPAVWSQRMETPPPFHEQP